MGSDGPACRDLNENGIKGFPAEDTNGDGVIDGLDCRGDAGGPTPPDGKVDTGEPKALASEDGFEAEITGIVV